MLTNVKVVEEHTIKIVPMFDLKIGEIGQVVDSPITRYNGLVVLRIFDGVVALDKPGCTWWNINDIPVRLIPNATVTLTFGSGS